MYCHPEAFAGSQGDVYAATITVVVTDAAGNTATYAYTSGSASGDINVPPP